MSQTLPLERLCIHQVTLMQCGFRESLECLARHQVRATALWHEKLGEVSTAQAKAALRDSGVRPLAICVGGLMASADETERRLQFDLSRRRLEQAHELGASSIVTLTGGINPENKDLLAARRRALDGVAELVPLAREAGVQLSLEPLHPMVCGFRSVLCTLDAACDALDELDAPDITGITLDTYALWWDLNLKRDIARAAGRIQHFHVSDWLAETRDVRLDRGMPGEGLIDNPAIRAWVEDTGFDGMVEVEIFSKLDWWKRDPDEVVGHIVERALPKL